MIIYDVIKNKNIWSFLEKQRKYKLILSYLQQ